MTERTNPARWRAVGGTVVGASHVRRGLPNQDAVLLPSETATTIVVAVSDGHGSEKCFRSDRGARLAVAAAVLVATAFLERARAETGERAEALAREWIPGEVARRWREAVELELVASPLTGDELARLEAAADGRARELVAASPILAYGATVLVAGLDDRSLVFAQLGDGDILVVSAAGEVSRPLPADERLFANETTSLASRSASEDFRVALRTDADARPALVMLSTDGYANSFRDEAGFLKVGADLFETIGVTGLDAVAADIPSWLDETSRMGSGDDVTLAVVCRTDAFPTPAPPASPTPPVSEAASPATTPMSGDGTADHDADA